MTEYRDDQSALRQRARVLEEDLAERDRRLAEQRIELERQRAELERQQSELVRLRAEAAAPNDEPAPAAASGDTRVCAACGKENREHYTFCLGCGADLRANLRAAEGPLPAPGDTSAQTPAPNASLQAQRRLVAMMVLVVALALGLLVYFAGR
jgi:hypothetical protein